MIKRMVVGVVILFAVLLLLLPRTDETSKKKMVSAAMLMCSNAYRQSVLQPLYRNEAITQQFNHSCPELITSVEVDEGTLVIHGAQHSIKLYLTPVMEAGALRWSCRGEPQEAVTKLCKP